MKIIWGFFQNQILGMRWLYEIINNVLTNVGFDINSKLGSSLQFFIFNVVKIFILLSVLLFIVSYIQSFFPPERTKKILSHFQGIWANILSALLGTITPFCSCSSIPFFIGFSSAGFPVGVTFSFLIASPLVNLGSLILIASFFGLKVAFSYVIVGVTLAVIGGTLIEKLGMERYVEDFIMSKSLVDIESPDLAKQERINYAKEQMVTIVKNVFVYVILGVAVGAFINYWISADTVQSVLGEKNPFSVILATLVGIPLYSDVFGTIPVAEALYFKGVSLGTILSFMMGVIVLSLPSILMLRKAVKPKLLIMFIGIVAAGIIIIGYIFNVFQFLFV
ncbi:MAG: permease [Clostridiales bacterium]|uniref:permease n=2 Tax=Aminipila sp. TaxID=2060095 RepID=UPI001D68ADB6|nr:permease [Aminipila sp.]MBE6033630.1 permease [Clostridiales bacterium]